MSKGIFITATGTDIGKTYVTALIVKKLKDAGYTSGYYKAALSGAEPLENGLLPGDADYVNQFANLHAPLKEMVSYVYEHAVSPHLATQVEGNPVEMSVVKRDYENACRKYEFVTVEGSGGIVCPIRYDEKEHIFLEDIIKELDLDCILVADAGLGTINSIVLTAEYMKHRDLKIKGIILNHYHKGDWMEEDNIKMVEEITNLPVLACVADGEQEIDILVEKLVDCYR